MTSVVVYGVDGPPCRHLVQQLEQSASLTRCEFFDVISGTPSGFVRAVHVPAGPDGLPRAGCLAELQGLASARIQRLVVLCSAAVHPPRHNHPGMVAEARPGGVNADPVAIAWFEVEKAARTLSGPEVVILRAAPTPYPGGLDWASRLLRGKLSKVWAGYDPPLQFLDPEDLAVAVGLALTGEVTGTCNVAPARPVPVRKAMRLAGKRSLPLPPWGMRLSGEDPGMRLRHPWTLGAGRSDALGFQPKHDSAHAVLRATQRAEPKGGMPQCDDFGLDPDYLRFLHRTVMKFLHDVWWRVEYKGLEHVPKQGRALMVGIHRGFMPFDGSMLVYALAKLGRIPRFLIHPSLVKSPFLAPFIYRQGGVIACRQNADLLLARDALAALFPEGIEGAFRPYRDAYTLGNFGRDEYVRMALRNRAPIIPFVTVGSAEIFPILGRINFEPLRRHLEWPYIPITPTFPLLPIPLPSKWHTRILEPIPVHQRYGPDAVDKPEVVKAIGEEIKALMGRTLLEMQADRKHIFHGSIF